MDSITEGFEDGLEISLGEQGLRELLEDLTEEERAVFWYIVRKALQIQLEALQEE